MRKTTLHVWIAMLICVAAMVTHADDSDDASVPTAASGHRAP